jgi:hypothetical protein
VRGSRARLASGLAALALAVSAFGGLVLPKLSTAASSDEGASGAEQTVLIVDTRTGDGCAERATPAGAAASSSGI